MICGVDEAGRGPLAGPVVAAAVLFRGVCKIPGLKDSKLLSPARRLYLASEISKGALAYSIIAVSPAIIDKINILRASLLAMQRAVHELPIEPDMINVDGPHVIPGLKIRQKAIIDGDNLLPEISAASIMAKVARDIYMTKCADYYPGYDFGKHKGYGTREHLRILKQLGPCPIHRMSFGPVAQTYLEMGDGASA